LLLELQKPPAPVALQGRLCLSGKPHEYKRSLVWLNLSTCPTPPSWENPGWGGHRSRSPFSSGDRAPLNPTSLLPV